MDRPAFHAALKNALAQPLRGMTPEQQADFMACLMSAVVAVLPEFISAMLQCMSGSTAPPAGGFDPGDRKRCD